MTFLVDCFFDTLVQAPKKEQVASGDQAIGICNTDLGMTKTKP